MSWEDYVNERKGKSENGENECIRRSVVTDTVRGGHLPGGVDTVGNNVVVGRRNPGRVRDIESEEKGKSRFVRILAEGVDLVTLDL